MPELSWEQKILALQAFCCEVSLKMREPGNWYVAAQISRVDGNGQSGGLVHAATPQKAVEDFWDWATDKKCHVRSSFGGDTRNARWNGFMWENVK